MLKVYEIINSVSVNGEHWRRVGGYRHIIIDESEKDALIITLENMSFNEVYECLSYKGLDGIWESETYFKHKPIIKVDYNGSLDPFPYKKFKQMSYKRELREWESVSLEWIMKNASADQCIQYLKERGMTACPILK